MKKRKSNIYFVLLLLGVFSMSHFAIADNKANNPSSLSFDSSVKGLHQARTRSDGRHVVRNKVTGTGQIKSDHIVFQGVVAPGNSPGCFDITGSVTFTSSSTLVMELGGTTPCTGYDQISAGGTMTINSATFNLVLIDGFVPQYGQTFNILNWGALAGAGFSTIDTSGAVLAYPLQWDLSQLLITGEVSVGIQSVANGDLAPWNNPDGVINVADALIAQRLVIGSLTPGALQYAYGDMNVDGVINIADSLLIMKLALN